jgi:hypothetical protein
MLGAESFKVMNLDLERLTCNELHQTQLEKRYSKYLSEFSRKEFENEFLLSEERIDEVFNIMTSFIEEALFTNSPIIYAQTTRMLKFYKNHLRRKQATVLFI